MKENKNFVKGSRKPNNYKYLPWGERGIYFITHDITGHYYIGQSNNLATRLSHHFSDLKRGNHGCRRLQELYNNSKYEDFSFDYFYIEEDDKMKEYELYLLNELDGDTLLLNSATKNNSWVLNNMNSDMVKEWKSKVSESSKKRVGSLNPFYGKTHSDEVKQRIRERMTGSSNESCWKGVVINGVLYESMTYASKKLKIPLATVHHRVKSENKLFVNWYEFQDYNEIIIFDDRLLFNPSDKPSGLYEIEGVLYTNNFDVYDKFNITKGVLEHRLKHPKFTEWNRLI